MANATSKLERSKRVCDVFKIMQMWLFLSLLMQACTLLPLRTKARHAAGMSGYSPWPKLATVRWMPNSQHAMCLCTKMPGLA